MLGKLHKVCYIVSLWSLVLNYIFEFFFLVYFKNKIYNIIEKKILPCFKTSQYIFCIWSALISIPWLGIGRALIIVAFQGFFELLYWTNNQSLKPQLVSKLIGTFYCSALKRNIRSFIEALQTAHCNSKWTIISPLL